MHYQEIMAALKVGDRSTIRDAFRALVDFPHETPVEASGPGPLVIALRGVCEALEGDDGTMPHSTCEALGAAQGTPYAIGAAWVKGKETRFGEVYKRHFEKMLRSAH